MILLSSVVENFSNSISRAVSDFFISILVYLYYYAGKIFPAVVGIVVVGALLTLSTIHGAKTIRRKAIFALIIVPFVCFVVYYCLAVFLSYHSAS